MIDRSYAGFDELHQGVKDIESLADPSTGEVRIGTMPPLAASFLSAVIDRPVKRHPRMAFQSAQAMLIGPGQGWPMFTVLFLDGRDAPADVEFAQLGYQIELFDRIEGASEGLRHLVAQRCPDLLFKVQSLPQCKVGEAPGGGDATDLPATMTPSS
jgi:hypothetical protein